MRLDAADLALIEIDAHKLGELAAGIIQMLVDRIREDEERTEAAEKTLAIAQNEAQDAAIALESLRQYLKEAPIEADRKADDVERCLEKIQWP